MPLLKEGVLNWQHLQCSTYKSKESKGSLSPRRNNANIRRIVLILIFYMIDDKAISKLKKTVLITKVIFSDILVFFFLVFISRRLSKYTCMGY